MRANYSQPVSWEIPSANGRRQKGTLTAFAERPLQKGARRRTKGSLRRRVFQRELSSENVRGYTQQCGESALAVTNPIQQRYHNTTFNLNVHNTTFNLNGNNQ